MATTWNGISKKEIIEYVPLGTFWSGDWDVPEDDIYAQTSGRDRMELLQNSQYSSSQVEQNKTLYDLAVEVLTDAGLKPEEYWIDTELQEYYVPYAYFEPMAHREALRLIIEACCGQAYCDRNGIVRVEGPSYLDGKTASDLSIDMEDYYKKNTPANSREFANHIEVGTQPLLPDTPKQEYQSNAPVSIAAGETKTITAYYSDTPCIDAVASIDGAPVGCIIQSAIYYAWGANVTITSPINAGAFTLTINATPLKVKNKEMVIVEDTSSIAANTMIKYSFPDNPLVQTFDMAQKIADILLEKFKSPQRNLNIEWRGNPALLLADRISVTDRNGTNDYFVTQNELDFDGTLRATLQGRRAI